MKKVIRLTESDLTRIVRRVISEEMNTSSFTKNSKVKIPIKKDNTFIVINIKDVTELPGKTNYYFTVVRSTFSDMENGYSNFLTVNKNNKTYELSSPYGEGSGGILQRGPIADIQIVN